MDKNSIKKYAVWARRELISRVSQKALQYGVSENEVVDANADTINGHLLTANEKKRRQALISRIKQIGYQQTMEEAAYTWFNRFSALRFMEVNGYLPTHVRVFTDEQNAFKPQIIAEAIHLELDGLNMEKVYELKDQNKTDELYKYLLITQCNALSAILPGMFTRIADYTELLFPDNLLREGSVIEQMISMIPEDDWKDAVQIIGWLYQYYNAEPKDKVFADLKKNIKICKENIPAATQLFTPDWIVRYMVENSLGRLWVEGHPNDELKANWKYYLEEAEQEPDVQAEFAGIRKEYAAIKPEEIKVIDPCMGSGHILVYMFDVLVQIYEAYGYNAREAAGLILQNNLYGLDIDDRAAQLAYFAVMMKARQYDRRIFSRGIQPHVYAIVESNGIHRDTLDYFENDDDSLKNALETIVEELHDAKEYGSILNVTQVNFAALYDRLKEIKEDINIFSTAAQSELKPLIDVAEVMAKKYHVVVTNPPYMGLRNMSAPLFNYVMKNHKDTKQDLFGVFMDVCQNHYCSDVGISAMITQHVWMFTAGFEKYRERLYATQNIISLVHLGTRAFEEISGEVVQTCSFVMRNKYINNYNGRYIRLVDCPSALDKETQFFNPKLWFSNTSSNYEALPGAPVCYWLSRRIIEIYKSCPLVSDVSNTRQGLKTSDDKRFVRMFFEVSDEKIAKNIKSLDEAKGSSKKWFWLNKGGQEKWYGNNIYLINWENDGKEVKDYATQVAGSYSKNITAIDAYFKNCISWPQISMSHPAFRYIPTGFIFASAGPSLFVSDPKQQWYMMGLLNSCVTQNVLDAINPTINFGVSDILKVPYIYSEENAAKVEELVKKAICTAKWSWDSFELSWDYARNPLVGKETLIQDAFGKWKDECDAHFAFLKNAEIELNTLFCSIYGLSDELDCTVCDNDVNVYRANLHSDIRYLISYAVGCMFGRYSLDDNGIACAGEILDSSKYKTFLPDKDNIIPVCDDDYFDDDITGRFIKWVETVYGKDTLEENLKFIADALGGKGTPRDVIRSYFINDFYADHLKVYQKRPIYWLFDSGKKNGFKALIYMHRYQPDTIARMRTDYVHEQQSRYRTAITDLEQRVNSASTGDRVKLSKKLQALQDQENEIRAYEEKIHHLADQMIRIDLDDGVKHNYEIFKDVLAKI